MFEKELDNLATEELFEAVLNLHSVEECKMFFRDLCTFKEIQDMAERWQIAKKVDEKMPYRKIATEVGSSTATITRVAHFVAHGMGGYSLMLERMKK